MTLRRKLQLDYYVGGVLHVLLKLPTMLLGKLLHRDHQIAPGDGVVFLKLLGGGSLVIAYPSLLAIKKTGRHLTLITTPGIKPFAEVLGVFDEIRVIHDHSTPRLALDSLAAIWTVRRCPVMVDLEIHSRLSTVFCLLTCARNRVSFYSITAFWRTNLATHLLYYNAQAPVYHFYDQVAQLLGAKAMNLADARAAFVRRLGQITPGPAIPAGQRHIGIAATCSNLSPERMLRPAEWADIISARVVNVSETTVHLLGAASEKPQLAELADVVTAAVPGLRVTNHAGAMPLEQSVLMISKLDRLLAIDSALLHFARLIGVPAESWWGPTSPTHLLREPRPAEAHYRALSCSPCIHVTGDRPCRGDNRCMRVSVLADGASVDDNPLWLVEPTGAKSADTVMAARNL